MPASDPRPLTTSDAAAMASQAASSGGQPRSSPMMNPAEQASPHPVVSTTCAGNAG
jgi:hypothetical protein